jgi:isocitrate dehydrogenase
VIIMTNMNGDILSDLTSGQIGGLGFAPSANLGNDVAIFEAVHGSAPKYAGKNVINPTALILTSVMLLRHLQEFDAAAQIENAVLYTLEQGKVMTRDVVGDAKASSTTAYTDEIIKNLGQKPTKVHVRDHKPLKLPVVSAAPDFVKPKTRRDMGVDIFVETNVSAEQLGKSLEKIAEGSGLKLKAISNRGTKVYSPTGAITDCVDHYACRFVLVAGDGQVTDQQIADLVQKIGSQYRWMHIEKLSEFDGAPSYTKSQGED